MSSMSSFVSGVQTITGRDARYHEDAYLFVMEALSRAFTDVGQVRHVNGKELLKAIAREAEEQFGVMAPTVLEHWRVKNSLDFGNIVFNMVEEGILSKSERDSLEDFRDGRSLRRVFRAGSIPQSRKRI